LKTSFPFHHLLTQALRLKPFQRKTTALRACKNPNYTFIIKSKLVISEQLVSPQRKMEILKNGKMERLESALRFNIQSLIAHLNVPLL
jgi:hypothetical protein